MASIRTGIELNDNFSSVLYGIISSVNLAVSAMEDMSQAMNTGVDTSSLESVREQLNQTTVAANELSQVLQDMGAPATSQNTQSQPVQWQSDRLNVFDGSGMERFEREVQSVNNMLNILNQTQNQIQQTASSLNILPDNAIQDVDSMGQRLRAIQAYIQQISNNSINMGTDEVNTELERMRAQLDQAIQEQNTLNTAMNSMDISAANSSYLRLSQIISGTERYIRENTAEQERFNSTIQEGTDCASDLNDIISKAVGAFAGMAGIKQIFSFVSDSMNACNTQLNAETQLMTVLANMLEDDYVVGYMVNTDVIADTANAVEEINAIQKSVDDVEITVAARTEALQAEFDSITAKASEIQSRGIYGDEAMIAGAAELSTYFTDTKAVEKMMDTLANYAMGMSGGGEIDSTSMVDYATGLGKVMSGAYDAMTKKGFEFTDAQKAIIEGTATQEQIVKTLGEEYLDMSEDMQAATAITQVIDESWAGMYETMSNTPQGKIIQMMNTWGDMKEVLAGQLYPYILLFVDTITENWGTIQSVLDGFVVALQNILIVLDYLFEGAMSFASVIVDNWSIIEPIVLGIVAAVGLYTAALITHNAIQAISNGLAAIAGFNGKVLAAAMTMAAGKTFTETAAQYGFNAALLACPITWIILAIIAFIAIIYAVTAAINHLTGETNSATGIICGTIAMAAAAIWNTILGVINAVIGIGVELYNLIAAFANFFANVFDDPVGAIIKLFSNMFDFILGIVQSAASLIDTVLGSDISGAVEGFRNDFSNAVSDIVGDQTVVMEKLNASDYQFDGVNYLDAFGAGYDFGEKVDEKIKGFDLSDLKNNNTPKANDYREQLANNNAASTQTAANTGDAAKNTDKISKQLDITSEDLKYIRDLAEQDYINRFTTAEIKIEMPINATINSDMDLDGVTEHLRTAIEEQMNAAAEGVH